MVVRRSLFARKKYTTTSTSCFLVTVFALVLFGNVYQIIVLDTRLLLLLRSNQEEAFYLTLRQQQQQNQHAHGHHHHHHSTLAEHDHSKGQTQPSSSRLKKEDESRAASVSLPSPLEQEQSKSQHRVAGLSCAPYDGPDDETAAEMVYWRDIRSDSSFGSSLAAPLGEQDENEQFLTFEPDEAGWNNVRMALETTVLIALATGRTLVLPPQQTFPHLDRHQPLGLNDLYHFDSLRQEGLKVLSFQDFLEQKLRTGRVWRDPLTGRIPFPPGNRTDWNGKVGIEDSVKEGINSTLWNWWRNVSTVLDWDFSQCVAVFPSQRGPDALKRLQQAYKQFFLQEAFTYGAAPRKPGEMRPWRAQLLNHQGAPTPVNATVVERLEEMMANRNALCLYNETLQNNRRVLHVTGEQKAGHRLLVPFYAFLFFEDWKHDLRAKRFVRVRMRHFVHENVDHGSFSA